MPTPARVPCAPCLVARQMAVNMGLVLDYGLNVLLGGAPNETLSRRARRAELAGSRAAALFCRAMGLLHKGHCAWALEPSEIGREVWDWTGARKTATATKETAHG